MHSSQLWLVSNQIINLKKRTNLQSLVASKTPKTKPASELVFSFPWIYNWKSKSTVWEAEAGGSLLVQVRRAYTVSSRSIWLHGETLTQIYNKINQSYTNELSYSIVYIKLYRIIGFMGYFHRGPTHPVMLSSSLLTPYSFIFSALFSNGLPSILMCKYFFKPEARGRRRTYSNTVYFSESVGRTL